MRDSATIVCNNAPKVALIPSEEAPPVTDVSQSLSLAEALCARLCHDLSGILAALTGVLEIAAEEQSGNETITIATDTAVELGERLKLLRAAWGPPTDDLDITRLATYGTGLAAGRRIALDLAALETGTVFPPAEGRVVLNLLLLAAEALPGGGTITLSGSPATEVRVVIAGPRAAWPAAVGPLLSDEAAARQAVTGNPRNIQAPLTALLASAHGFCLSMPTAISPTVPPPLVLTLFSS